MDIFEIIKNNFCQICCVIIIILLIYYIFFKENFVAAHQAIHDFNHAKDRRGIVASDIFLANNVLNQ